MNFDKLGNQYISFNTLGDIIYSEKKPEVTDTELKKYGNSLAIYTLKKIQESFLPASQKEKYAGFVYDRVKVDPDSEKVEQAKEIWKSIQAENVPMEEKKKEVGPNVTINELDKEFPECSSMFKKYGTEKSIVAHATNCSESFKIQNEPKNRYSNIIQWDRNLVTLKNENRSRPWESEKKYINAGVDEGWDNKLILSQAPFFKGDIHSVDTVNDHWQMIWDKGVERVLRLTKGLEKKGGKEVEKTADYDVGKFGNITSSATRLVLYEGKEKKKIDNPNLIYLFNLANAKGGYKPKPPDTFESFWKESGKSLEEHIEEWKISTLEERCLGFVVTVDVRKGEEPIRTIKIDHFSAWPDHGLPDEAATSLFLDRVEKAYTLLNAGKSVLVHCSAGIGRTGVFWTLLDLMRDAVRAIQGGKHPDSNPNVSQRILEGRQKVRPGLVQTEPQRQFIQQSYPKLLPAVELIAKGEEWKGEELRDLRGKRRKLF